MRKKCQNLDNLKVGDRVALISPNTRSPSLAGTILEITTLKAKVKWDGFKPLRRGQILKHKLLELRHIEE